MRTVASELTKNGDHDIASKTDSRGPVVEESTVVPPSLISSVKLETLVVFLELHPHPHTLGVALTMVLDKHLRRFIELIVHVEPSGGFGQEPNENDDASREH